MPQNAQMDIRILDRIAAGRAQGIVDNALDIEEVEIKAKDVDNLVTKALGVLQENGVYAGFLFLFSRTRKEDKAVAEVVRKELVQLAANELGFGWANLSSSPSHWEVAPVLSYVSDILCADLDPLLMTKQVFEQTLIYARYGAKAQKNEGR